jgi:hypothetical protein
MTTKMNTQILTISLLTIATMPVLAYIFAIQGKSAELNALRILNLKYQIKNMKKLELVRYTLSYGRRIVNYFANIKEVKWLDGKIQSIRVKSYTALNREYFDNNLFKSPNIPKELLDYVMNNKEKFTA